MRQGRIKWRVGVCGVLALVLSAGVLPGAEPDALEVLRVARLASTSQEATVRGQLRMGAELAPFTLEVKDGRLLFAFENPRRVFEVRLGYESSGVYDAQGRPFSKGMKEPVVNGADVTIEDLSLGFLYWPDARLLGEETVRTRPTRLVELRPGKRGSEFAVVRVWVEQESGALMRIEGFDWEGKLLRRFEVVSGQRIDGQWMLKQMRIERFGPDNATRPVTRSYLEILGKDGV